MIPEKKLIIPFLKKPSIKFLSHLILSILLKNLMKSNNSLNLLKIQKKYSKAIKLKEQKEKNLKPN
jgi:hypothetical protein